MLHPALSKAELHDIQGKFDLLKVIEFMPTEIDKELKSILDNEDAQRELKESQRARSSI
jgi:hypothetical protein